MSSLSLYLHIPFCRHRCAYCDFNTYTSLDALKEEYAAALCTEIRQVAGAEIRPVHTIFFGGGTPSLMSPASLQAILDTVRDCFALSPQAEITIEANPGTVDQAYLEAIHRAGVNRISYGVQSANQNELRLLEREHTFSAVIEAVQWSRAAGINNLNLDLIYGLPGQTLAAWERSVQAVLDLQTEHISLYCLTIEPGTPMHRWLQNGQIEEPDPDAAADQYELATELLARHGWEHYEISNWAKRGRACEHNLTYWRNHEYLGLGAGAHGHAHGYRYHVVKQPRVYLRRLQERQAQRYPWSSAVAGIIPLTLADQMGETMITQLRLLQEGLDIRAFVSRFGQTPQAAYPGILERLVEDGLLVLEEEKVRLTDRGRFLSNQVFYHFV
ncbi:MAG: radical SAM family heme chaperone HemW [Chloroflexi bacterium]|nr:radical SAM family heme chaperone HemW [Chloroflexota bacterium]MBP8058223.1 radical SAM family heme chaperone HemW [Chloroflexota bacterium]